ncbi:putative DNA binding domain-containing protein [Cyanobacteria bacterium FACHB-DQ100]|nr:putative DNA binding domain-containing protein [Cyanobacteria bacterium FACHB-DQ100]
MDETQLRKLLNQPNETVKLEFKSEMYKLEGQRSKLSWNELVKDIIALANGNLGTANEYGYLIIGAENTPKDGIRGTNDVGDIKIKDRQILQKINEFCDKYFQALSCDTVILDGKRIFVISIPPSDYLYELKKPLTVKTDGGTKEFSKGSILLRGFDGEEIYKANDEERWRIREEKENRHKQESELYKRLVNYQNIENEIREGRLFQLLEKYSTVFNLEPTLTREQREELCLIQAALRCSDKALNQDFEQLACQITGRLASCQLLNVQTILKGIEEHQGDRERCWLKPLSTSLKPPIASLLHSLKGHRRPIQALIADASSEKLVSVSSDGTLNIWDLNSGNLLKTWHIDNEQISILSITPDSKKIIIISDDFALQVWDISTGNLIFSLEGHQAEINAIAFTPSSEKIISASDDKALRVWSLTDGECVYDAKLDNPISSLVISKDGKYGFLGVDTTIYAWQLSSESLIKVDVLLEQLHESQITILILLPDQDKLISASDDETLRIWDLKKNVCQAALSGYFIKDAAVAPNGSVVIFSDDENLIRIWDYERDVIDILDDTEQPVSMWTLTPDGKRVVTVPSNANFFNEVIYIWDLESRQYLTELPDHRAPIFKVIGTPNSENFISASEDKILNIWSLLNNQLLQVAEKHVSEVRDILVSLDGEHAISFSDDQTLKLWQISDASHLKTFEADGQVNNLLVLEKQVVFTSEDESRNNVFCISNFLSESARPTLLGQHSSFINSIVVTPDSQYVISASDDSCNNLKVWDLASEVLYKQLEGHSDSIKTLAINSEKKWLISSSANKTLIWDLKNFERLYTFEGKSAFFSQLNRSRNKIITPRGRYYISAGNLDLENDLGLKTDDLNLNIWDLHTGQSLYTLRKDDQVTAIAIDLAQKYLISTNYNNDLEVWDIQNNKRRRSFAAHSQIITSIVIASNNRYAVSTSNDCTLKVWDLKELESEDFESGEVLKPITIFTGESEIKTCAISPENIIIAGEKSGRVHFLRLQGT